MKQAVIMILDSEALSEEVIIRMLDPVLGTIDPTEVSILVIAVNEEDIDDERFLRRVKILCHKILGKELARELTGMHITLYKGWQVHCLVGERVDEAVRDGERGS